MQIDGEGLEAEGCVTFLFITPYPDTPFLEVCQTHALNSHYVLDWNYECHLLLHLTLFLK